eukprot:TRINITY_DN155_c0_g1_i1.p1 TRINITY_DN155_c0_g1~~TRINITY_DN155_c0_g1_i1.p1  ORF type:complete len:1503 (+),score=195.61 TRINITY_DN155_c0_g1_i1:3205-7713(+)
MEGKMEASLDNYLVQVLESPQTIPEISKAVLSQGMNIPTYLVLMDKFLWGAKITQPIEEAVQKLNVPSKICGKMISMVWFCEQCCLDGTSCYCTECFDKKLHEGHKYSYVVGGGGLCDCGDKTAIDPAGFCKTHVGCQDEKKILEHYIPLLPAHVKVSAPATITALMELLHSALVGEMKKTEDYKKAFVTVKAILMYLANLCTISPVFQHWIEEGLDQVFPEHMTEHTCKTKYFVNETLKNAYNERVKDIAIKSESLGPHPCTCSVLELLMSLYSILVVDPDIYQFLCQLIKQREDFPPKAALAFCQNIHPILRFVSTQAMEEFETALSQFLNGAWAEFIVKSPEYMPVIFQMYKDFFGYCNSINHRPRTASIIFSQIISPFFGERPGKILASQEKFWTQFLQIIASNELVGYCEDIAINELVVDKTEGVFETFTMLIKHLDLENEALLTHVLTQLRQLMEKSANTATSYLADKNYFTLECERIWAWILSVLLVNYSIDQVVKDPLNYFKEKVIKFMGYSDQKQLDIFIEDLLNMTVKLLSLVGNLRNKPRYNDFLRQEYFGMDIEHFYHSDICLLTICLLLTSKPWRLLEFIDSHFKPPWVGNDLSTAPEDLMKATNNNLEMLLYTLLTCISNDFPLLHIYYWVCSHQRGPNTFYTRKGKDTALYFLPMQVVSSYLAQDKVYTPLKRLEFHMDYELRKENIGAVIEKVFTKKKAGRETLFGLKIEGLKYVNLLWDSAIGRFGTYEEKLRAIMEEICPKDSPKPNMMDYGMFEPTKGIFENLTKELARMGLFQKLATLLATHQRINENVKILAAMLMYRIIISCDKENESKLKTSVEAVHGLPDALREIQSVHTAFDVGIKKILAWLTGEEELKKAEESSPVSEKEKIKEKQKEIMAQFAAKQKIFLEKQHVPEALPKLKEPGKTCVICREELRPEHFAENPYGLLASHSFSRLNKKAETDFINSWKSQHPNVLNTTQENSSLEHYGVIQTCGHYVHLKCKSSYLLNNADSSLLFTKFKSFLCPLCKTYSKLVLPEILVEKTVCKTEEIMNEVSEVIRTVFMGGPKVDVEEVLENLTANIVHNVNGIDLIGVEEYCRSKSEPTKLLMRNTLAYLYEKAGEKLIPLILKQRKSVEKEIDKEDICKKDVAGLLMKYILCAHYDNFVSTIMEKKSEVFIVDKNCKALLEALVVQIVWKQLCLHWCNKKLVVYEFPSSQISREEIIKGIAYEFEKVWCCLNLGEDEILSNKIEKDTEERFKSICKKLGMKHETILEIIDRVKHVMEYPKGVIESPIAQKLERMFCLACSMAGKVTVPEEILILGERKFVKFIPLESSFRKLYEHYMSIPCSTCPTKCSDTSICLFCGSVVCIKNCCGMPEEQIHSMVCSGGEGLFIALRNGALRIASEIGILQIDSVYVNFMGNSVNGLFGKVYNFSDTDLEGYTLSIERVKRLEDICAKGALEVEMIHERFKTQYQQLFTSTLSSIVLFNNRFIQLSSNPPLSYH